MGLTKMRPSDGPKRTQIDCTSGPRRVWFSFCDGRHSSRKRVKATYQDSEFVVQCLPFGPIICGMSVAVSVCASKISRSSNFHLSGFLLQYVNFIFTFLKKKKKIESEMIMCISIQCHLAFLLHNLSFKIAGICQIYKKTSKLTMNFS